MKFTLLLAVIALIVVVNASSHSEAPGTAKHPKSDISDFYMFQCYEPGREDRTCFIMNTQPLAAPYAGPNYYAMSDEHFYELYIDNDGDAIEDHTFQFYFGNRLGGNEELVPYEIDDDECGASGVNTASRNIGPSQLMTRKHAGVKLNIGDADNNRDVAIPLKFFGQITSAVPEDNLNFFEWYRINHIDGDRTFGDVEEVTNAQTGDEEFKKPFDYAGTKTFPDYESYADDFIYNIDIPNCGESGRVFVGQRAEPFYITLGATFDLVNYIPIPGLSGVSISESDSNNDLARNNVGSIVLEIPTECLLNDDDDNDVLGAWSAIRTLRHSGDEHVPGKQVSRLGNPLINELFVGLNDKKYYTQNEPKDDPELLDDYINFPTFPAILDLLFLDTVNSLQPANAQLSTIAPTNFPRDDLYAIFMTGIPTINSPANVQPAEMMRLNTTIPVTSRANQSPFGVIGGDAAGYPNGRRPGDDSVDISLRAAMGRLCALNLFCAPEDAPLGTTDFTDGSPISADDFLNQFPYLNTPIPGSDGSTTVFVATSSSDDE